MTLCTSTNLRRFAFAAVLAGAATFSSTAVGDPSPASAKPREWDIGSYDNCTAQATAWFVNGVTNHQELQQQLRNCCEFSGGVFSETQECVAPTGEEAQEAERAPVETPFIGPDATLWIPPSVGPVAPPPSEVMQAP